MSVVAGDYVKRISGISTIAWSEAVIRYGVNEHGAHKIVRVLDRGGLIYLAGFPAPLKLSNFTKVDMNPKLEDYL
jgi:hypothetical protein